MATTKLGATARALAAGILLGAACLVVAPAMSAPNAEAERWAMLRLGENAFSGSEDLTKDKARTRLMLLFDQADTDGNGISQADYDQAQRFQEAQQRANRVQMILRDDLDADGRVTRDEYIRAHRRQAQQPMMSGGIRVEPTREQVAQVLDALVTQGMKADVNRDGVITYQEMIADAVVDVQRMHGSGYRQRETIPLSLDANGDHVVSRAEFTALLDRAFDVADTNHDGRLSKDERTALQDKMRGLREEESTSEQTRRQVEAAQRLTGKCAFPKVQAGATMVYLSTYEGQALSTVALGGDDEEVTVAHVSIEPGSKPLALLLTSFSANVWLIDGNVGRIAQVIVTSTHGDASQVPRVGVVGVPRAKVFIAGTTECLRSSSGRAKGISEADAKMLTGFFGRTPDLFFSEENVSSIALPSGKTDAQTPLLGTVAPHSDSPAAEVWSVMLTYNPMGLVEIDPAKVVSTTRAARYAVLPQEAGLAQLVESGALEIAGRDEEVRIGGTRIRGGGGDDVIRGASGEPIKTYTVPTAYLIKKQITLPAGLAGAHSVKFILPPGVPEPAGSLGHSQILRRPN